MDSKICTKCGETKPLDGGFYRDKSARDGRQARCKACAKAYHADWYAKNRDEVLAHQAEYRQENRDTILARKAEYYAENRDAALAYRAEYYAKNRDEVLAQQAKHRARPEVKARMAEYYARPEVKARKAEYRQAHPEIWWESQYRLRSQRFGFEPVVDHFTRAELIAKWGDACYLCGGEWDQLEHVTPVSRGGEHSLDNCRPACEPCNRRAWAEYRHAESV